MAAAAQTQTHAENGEAVELVRGHWDHIKTTTPSEDFIKVYTDMVEQMSDPQKKVYNGHTCLLLGSSGSGKTSLIRSLIDGYYAPHKYIVIYFTSTRDSDALVDIEKQHPNVIICDGLQEDIIAWVKHQQDTFSKERLAQGFLIVLDDIVAVKNKKILEQAFLVYRNSNISSIVCIQYLKLIPPSIRTSIYSVVCLKSNNYNYNELICDTYLSSVIPGKNNKERAKAYAQHANGKGKGFFVNNIQGGFYLLEAEEGKKQGGFGFSYRLFPLEPV